MNKFIKYYFLSLTASPLMAYLLRAVYEQKIALLTIYGNFSVLIVLILIVRNGIKGIRLPDGTIPLLLMAVYVGIWDFFNGVVDERGVAIVLFRNYYLFTLTTLIIIINTEFSERFIRTLMILLSITVIPAFLVSMIQATIDPVFMTPDSYVQENAAFIGNMYEMRPPSIFGHLDLNEVGLSFVPILSLILGYRLYKKLDKGMTAVLLLLGSFVCIATNARYIMISLLAILAQLLIVDGFKFKKLLVFSLWSIAGSFVVLEILVRVVGYDLTAFFEERILSGSAGARVLAVVMFAKYFPENPIFGTGVRVTDRLFADIQFLSSQIHVGYLSLFYEYGIVGGVLTLWFWYLVLRNLYWEAKFTGFHGSVLGFVTFLLANVALVQYYIYFYGLMYIFVLSKHMKDSGDAERGEIDRCIIQVT